MGTFEMNQIAYSKCRREARTTHSLLAMLGILALLATLQLGAIKAEAQTDTDAPVNVEEPASPPTDDGKLTPGVIASFGTFKRAKAIDTAGDATPGGEASPIRARVSRSGSDRCTAVVSNPSKTDSYSITFDVVGSGNDGSQGLKKTFSATLGPEKSVERSVTCRAGLNMAVVLRSGKRLN